MKILYTQFKEQTCIQVDAIIYFYTIVSIYNIYSHIEITPNGEMVLIQFGLKETTAAGLPMNAAPSRNSLL